MKPMLMQRALHCMCRGGAEKITEQQSKMATGNEQAAKIVKLCSQEIYVGLPVCGKRPTQHKNDHVHKQGGREEDCMRCAPNVMSECLAADKPRSRTKLHVYNSGREKLAGDDARSLCDCCLVYFSQRN